MNRHVNFSHLMLKQKLWIWNLFHRYGVKYEKAMLATICWCWPPSLSKINNITNSNQIFSLMSHFRKIWLNAIFVAVCDIYAIYDIIIYNTRSATRSWATFGSIEYFYFKTLLWMEACTPLRHQYLKWKGVSKVCKQ